MRTRPTPFAICAGRTRPPSKEPQTGKAMIDFARAVTPLGEPPMSESDLAV